MVQARLSDALLQGRWSSLRRQQVYIQCVFAWTFVPVTDIGSRMGLHPHHAFVLALPVVLR
jgi:hypothetical protein